MACDYHSPPECRTNCAAAEAGGDAPSVKLLRDADCDLVPSLACCAFAVPANMSGGNLAIDVDPDVTVVHRVKIARRHFTFNALVARPVRKEELAATPDARKAMDDEWTRLINAKVWDTSVVRE